MQPNWTFLLAMAVVAAVIVWRSFAERRASADEIFTGLVPGLVPIPPDQGVRELIKPGPEYSGPIAVAFNPPKGVRAGLAGTIVDGNPEPRDVIATIVDLAARGFLKITVVESQATRTGRDWELTATGSSGPIEPGELTLLGDLFVGGSPVLLSSLPATGNQAVPNARHQLWDECLQRGWFRRPTSRRVPRSAEGTAVQIQALGFKQYLATAEKEQFSYEEASGIFSKYLPYAIVFGVADHWTKVFGELAAQAEADGYDSFDLLWLGMAGWGMADAIVDLAMFATFADGFDGGFDMFGDNGLDGLGGDVAGSLDAGPGDGGWGDLGGSGDAGGMDSGGWGDFGGGDFGGGDFGGFGD